MRYALALVILPTNLHSYCVLWHASPSHPYGGVAVSHRGMAHTMQWGPLTAMNPISYTVQTAWSSYIVLGLGFILQTLVACTYIYVCVCMCMISHKYTAMLSCACCAVGYLQAICSCVIIVIWRAMCCRLHDYM